MKIEIGESIILSWLRHEKHCQVVQMNWKPSTSTWTLQNKEKINAIIEHFQNVFQNVFHDDYGIDLFRKSSSISQIIKQGEIGAFGLEVAGHKIENIFTVDVAFHEHGLNYKSPKVTTASVLKKMIRSAIAMLGYMDIHEGEIIFASPKIPKSVYVELCEHSKFIEEELNKKWNCNFDFQIIANYDFYKKILSPITKQSRTIADTSELFVRSIQLYNLFSYNTDKYNIEKIEYKTTACFGTCPIFEIVIDKNKESIFIAESFNFSKKNSKEIKGKFKTIISVNEYENIIELLNYMDFPKLRNSYSVGMITDLPGCTLKVMYNNGKGKIISDYGNEGTVELIQLYSIISALRFNQNWEKMTVTKK